MFLRKVPSQLMDSVGLDTVEHIEEHYIKERQLPDAHLNWLRDNYIASGKLGLKTPEKGGLYPPPAPGTQTRILLLNIGLVEPLVNRSIDQILNSGQVLAYTIENKGSRPVALVSKLPCPDGIDVAKSTKRMYWTNMGNIKLNDGSLQSANLDGTDVQYVLPPGSVHTPKQMVIDQDNNKIYLCDREGLRVMRCNLDGSDLEAIYQTGNWKTEPEKKENPIYWPVGITISKQLNKFFWTQKGHPKANEGRILSASLETLPSTKQDVDVVIEGLPECIDLEFDDEEGVLYWTDRGELPLGNTLNKKHIIGNPPPEELKLGRQIIAQGLGEGIGLRLDKANKCLYVADMSGHLWKCSTDYGFKEKLLEGETHAYTGICFYKV
jgi:DNA-binding beta-propeller fold protein YncE